jgi:hypothetical protein
MKLFGIWNRYKNYEVKCPGSIDTDLIVLFRTTRFVPDESITGMTVKILNQSFLKSPRPHFFGLSFTAVARCKEKIIPSPWKWEGKGVGWNSIEKFLPPSPYHIRCKLPL